DGESLIAALHDSWAEDYPDLRVEDSGTFYLGGLPGGQYELALVTQNGTPVKVYLTGAVSAESGLAHVLIFQMPAEGADETYAAVFGPLLRSLQISQ
ncbi:MAG: hypothetical protein HY784_15370, partial [Chloroflexi bacterium]|nr:hypothetical protein [Chloroflexota bacterium]